MIDQAPKPINDDDDLMDFAELRRRGGPSRAKAYELINSGALRAVKLGGRTKIRVGDYRRYVSGLPAVAPKQPVQG